MDTRPAMPVAVDQFTGRVRQHPVTGELLRDDELIFTEYDAGRLREGYCCFACLEAQIEDGLPVAFPERCSACGFPMRDKQRLRFAEEFEGDAAPIGPSRSIEQLRAEDDELKEKQRRQREGRSTSHIWVPRGV